MTPPLKSQHATDEARRKILRHLRRQGRPCRWRDIAHACGVSTLNLGNVLACPWFDRVGRGLYLASTAGLAALAGHDAQPKSP